MAITLVIGGARSGKSEFAEKLAADYGGKVTYIATAIPFDDQMISRINKHVARRPQNWTTIEKYKNFLELENDEKFVNADCVLIDCLSVLTTNWMMDSKINFDSYNDKELTSLELDIENCVQELMNVCAINDKELILVTNEVGQGVIPATKMGSIFRDLSGSLNRLVADNSDCVYYVVAGIPMKIKDKGVNRE